MMITLAGFIGEIPKLHPRALPPNAAKIAMNTRLDDGALTPLSGSTFVTNLGQPRKTVYLNGATWLAWDDAVDVVPGPTATDRLYVTGDGIPKMYANDTWYDLALAAPVDAPTISIASGTVDQELIETIHYAYTFVTTLGEESSPSPLSEGLDWSEGCAVNVTGFSNPTAGRAIDRIRIYRSVTGLSGATDLYFVKELPVATTDYDHDVALEPIQELITTMTHATPPDNMAGIIAMPNGMMVAHTDREILFCEPYQPHTWPIAYRLTVDYDIVGLSAFGSQLAVMTKGTPYRGQGTHPDTFALEKVEENLPCVSKRGIVDLGYAAAYPSTEGLVLVSGASAQIVTRQLFSKTDWDALDPSSIVAVNHSGRYLFGCSGSLGGGVEQTAMIDLSGQVPFLTRTSVTLQCAYYDIRSGLTYIQDQDDQLYIFDDTNSGSSLLQRWRSKVYDFAFDALFSVILVEGEDLESPSGFEARVYADNQLIHTITELNQVHRLPVARANHWEVEILGHASVTSASLASSMSELAGRP